MFPRNPRPFFFFLLTCFSTTTPRSTVLTFWRSDDVKELLSLVSQLRGFPSHPSNDIYSLDTKVHFNTFDIQWGNQDDDSVVDEVAGEQKDDFKRIVDSIEALGRTFAKQDSAI